MYYVQYLPVSIWKKNYYNEWKQRQYVYKQLFYLIQMIIFNAFYHY